MEIVKIPIETLNAAPYNPRMDLKPGDKDYDKLKKSILAFGYIDPIIVNKQGNIVVGGHQRLKILQEMGHESVEVSLVDLPLDQEKALNLALNKTGGEWQMAKLQDLLAELQLADLDIEITGFDSEEIERLMNDVLINEEQKDVKEDDFDVEEALKEPTISKPGDVWLLGKHRLVCGDSTDPAVFNILMDGKKANLCVTDPPFGVCYKGKAGTIKNDNLKGNEFYMFLLAAFKNMYEVLDDGGAIYVFHADTEGLNFRNAFRDAGFKLSSVCQWVKQSLVLGRSDYHWKNEPVIYGWKPTGPHNWYADRKQTTIWNFDRPSKSESHPTTKPIPLIAYPIQNSSLSNGIVLDPFGGSGSTLMACEQTNRICHTIELDEKYADVIAARFIKHIGTDENVFLIRDGVKRKYSEVGGIS